MTNLDQAIDQASSGQETATTGAVEGTQGDEAQNQPTDTGAGGNAESFFDPESIKHDPNLMQAYKQMQGAFTKKMQSASAYQKKIEAYDNFERDPLGTLKNLSQQYGYSLVQGQQPQQGEQEKNFETWDDVLKEAETRAEERVLKRLEPLIGKVSELQQKNTESYLDNNYHDWRLYEDDMVDLIKQHPTLAKDPDMLYRMALPEKVRAAKATKSALTSLTNSSQAAQIAGGSQTTKKPSTKPSGSMSLDQAVEYAKAQLATKGIRAS